MTSQQGPTPSQEGRPDQALLAAVAADPDFGASVRRFMAALSAAFRGLPDEHREQMAAIGRAAAVVVSSPANPNGQGDGELAGLLSELTRIGTERNNANLDGDVPAWIREALGGHVCDGRCNIYCTKAAPSPASPAETREGRIEQERQVLLRMTVMQMPPGTDPPSWWNGAAAALIAERALAAASPAAVPLPEETGKPGHLYVVGGPQPGCAVCGLTAAAHAPSLPGEQPGGQET